MGIVSDPSPEGLRPNRPPAYFWAVGLLSLLWNVWGAYIALSAQSGSLPALRAEDQAYFDSQPLWFVLLGDAALLAGIAGAMALLLQHRSAVMLYAAMLVTIVLANFYDLVRGTSPMLTVPGALVGSLILFAIMGLQVWFAHRMRRRGVLE